MQNEMSSQSKKICQHNSSIFFFVRRARAPPPPSHDVAVAEQRSLAPLLALFFHITPPSFLELLLSFVVVA